MKKFTLLFISIISAILLTGCFRIDTGDGTPTPTPETPATPEVTQTPTPVSEYTVTFINGNDVYQTSTVKEGEKINKPANPTKEGFTFICWSTNSTSKQEYNFNNPIKSNITLYAYFEKNTPSPVVTYTVAFMDGDTLISTLQVNKGSKVNKPTDPTKDGYTFICWSTSSTSKQEYDFNMVIRDDLTLYAYFEKNNDSSTETPEINTYTISFMNGSSVHHSTTINEGTKVTKPTDPTKDGYTFICWSTSSTSKQEYDFNMVIRDDLTLYAYFEEIIVENETFSVTFMNGNVVYQTSTVQEGEKTNKPADPTKEGFTFVCWSTSNTSKQEYNFNSTISSDLTLYAYFKEIIINENPINVTKFSGYNEGAYLEFDSEGYKSSDYTVTYSKQNSSTKYTVDSELIRNNGSTIRVDILGLVEGTYNVTITNNINHKTVTKAIYANNHDRSGYAHFDNTVGVGAYNDDGSLKTNAIVIYVNDSNKNTVTAKLGNKTYTGLGAILTAAKNSDYPLCIRVLGSVKTAQWNYKNHGEGKTSARDQSLSNTFSGASFSSGKLSYSAIISAGINSMSNDINNGITILNGLTNNVLYSSGEYDSYYNMLDISNASNITIEGVGTNAVIYQWGLNFKQCNNIEVRNLTFDRYTEDAVGFEGSKSNISEYGNYWVHNCTFNIGVNNWDVSYEADKYDGDGSTDIKYCRGVTVSYTTYNQTHKTMLIGGNDEAKQYNITLHHNYFNNCSSRLPLVRQANIHIYNNFYYKTTSVSSSIRANSYAFIENNYYENSKNPIMIVKKDSYTGTSFKSFGNLFSGCSKSNNSSTDTYYSQNTVYSRTDSITGSCNPTGSKELINFDTNSTIFYYDSVNQVSKVENLLTADKVKDHCIKYSGVLKGDFVSENKPEQPTPETPSNPDDEGDSENPTLSTKYITFNDINVENISASTTFGDITINPLSGKTCATGGCDLMLDNQQINKCLRLGGGGSYSSLNVNFDITASANITVYFSSSGTSTRYAALFDSSNNKIQAEIGSSSQNDIASFTFTNVDEGNYSIASAGSGLNIYLIVIEYI